MLDVLAGQVAYAHHLIPVWRLTQGTFWTTDKGMLDWLSARDVPARLLGGPLPNPVITAGILDYAHARRRRAPALAYMEHGCGQSYGGDPRTMRHAAYAGGEGRDRCSLILAPNDIAATRWRARYSCPVHVIGATRELAPPQTDEPLLVLSFHWDGGLLPEMRTALHHYSSSFALLGLPIALHAHPRAAATVAREARRSGIEFIPDIEDVARRATVYAVDNSSTLWELGRTRPVIALDDPRYRRHVEHGLRFWSHCPQRVSDATELRALATRLLEQGESAAERDDRERICSEVIPGLDGAYQAARLLSDWARGT